MRVILLNMVLGSVSFGCVRCLRYMLARRVCRRQLLPRRVDGICGRGPKLALGEESAPRRGAKRIPGRRACVRRAGLQVARHAERETERQTGREPTCSIDLSWHEIAESRSEQRCHPLNPLEERKGTHRTEALTNARPNLSPLPWFSGCKKHAWKDWDRGRGSRLRGHVQSGRLSCHWQKLRHRRRCPPQPVDRRNWSRCGTAQETGTSLPFGEKEKPAASAPLAFVFPPHTVW